MNNPLDNCLSVPEMAEEIRMSTNGFRNHRLAEVKASCEYFQVGKKIYVNEKHFARYINKFKHTPNQGD